MLIETAVFRGDDGLLQEERDVIAGDEGRAVNAALQGLPEIPDFQDGREDGAFAGGILRRRVFRRRRLFGKDRRRVKGEIGEAREERIEKRRRLVEGRELTRRGPSVRLHRFAAGPPFIKSPRRSEEQEEKEQFS